MSRAKARYNTALKKRDNALALYNTHAEMQRQAEKALQDKKDEVTALYDTAMGKIDEARAYATERFGE